MKIQKPEEEKYFKDITLNHILKEISNENGNYTTEPLYTKTENKSQKNFYFQIIFFGILPILLLLFFFSPISETDKLTTKTPITLATEQKTITTIKRKEKLPNKVESPIKKEQIKTMKIISKKSESKPNVTKEIVRANAKEALLKQMKN